MKATGIVRRIDDLGRIVIPKEIRRTLRIREGDPLEIYTDSNGEVIFKKYSPLGEMGQSAQQMAQALSKQFNGGVVVLDRDHCIASAGIPKKEVNERRLTQKCEEYIEERKSYIKNDTSEVFPVLEGVEKPAVVLSPVISSGDVAGAVALLDKDSAVDESDFKMCMAAAEFLGLQMEE